MTMAVEDEEEIAALSSKFECVKIAMNQDKTGFILKLSIHPNDAPEDLLRDVVGTRYLMVAVRIGEDDRPVPSPLKRNQDVALKIAHAICRDPRFQSWLMQRNMADEMSEEAAAQAIRVYLNIASRSELKSNTKARERLLALRDEFAQHLRSGVAIR